MKKDVIANLRPPTMAKIRKQDLDGAVLAYFLSCGIPFIITGLRTLEKWTPEHFANVYGPMTCRVEDSSGILQPYQSTVQAFCHAIRDPEVLSRRLLLKLKVRR